MDKIVFSSPNTVNGMLRAVASSYPAYYNSYPAARISGKHYFLLSFCFAGVSGSCVIPLLARSVSPLIAGDICPGYLFPLFRFFRHV